MRVRQRQTGKSWTTGGKVTVLAGGVGAAKFIRGLIRVISQRRLSIIINTADDQEFFGLHVSPDIDTVIYTLSGIADAVRGWGRADDSFRCLGELGRFYGPPWFKLGDQDLATHIFRSQQLAQGRSLSATTETLAAAFGVQAKVLPMTNDRVRTVIATRRGDLPFQEYFVRRQARPQVKGVRLRGMRKARPAPGVIESIEAACAVIIAPSNPVVSVAPILALTGVRSALARTRAPIAAISPLLGRKAISGPAAALLRATGRQPSAVGVASVYAPFLDLMVLDKGDIVEARQIRSRGVRTLNTDIVIPTAHEAELLARRVLVRLSGEARLSS